MSPTSSLQAQSRRARPAIETDPASLEADSLLGQLYASQNRLDAARETFEEVVKWRQEDVSAHTLVALIEEMQGNTAAARQRYEHIVRMDPNAAVACNNLAYIYAEHGGTWIWPFNSRSERGRSFPTRRR